MTSAEQLQDQVRAFLDGRASLNALEEWLAQAAAEAADADDAFRRLHNSVWLRVGEFDQGLVTEDQLVGLLLELVPLNFVTTWEGVRVPTAASAHRSISVVDVRWQPIALTSQRWQLAATR
jgi:hypothetical protein